MTESELIKRQIANNLAIMNEAAVADAIEVLIDIRVAELLEQLSERLEKMPRS